MPILEFPHFFLSNSSESFEYRSRGGGRSEVQPRNRLDHARMLLSKFNSLLESEQRIKNDRQVASLPVKSGFYVEFSSSPDFELYLSSMENITQGIRLLNVRSSENTQLATVFIPEGKEGCFLKKISDYRDHNTRNGNPKNAPLITSIQDIKEAVLTSFWTDDPRLVPDDEPKWIEAWLRVSHNAREQEVYEFITLLSSLSIEHKTNTLTFPERTICLIKANKSQLINLIQSSELLAEFRANHETAEFWVNENNLEQRAWVEDLISRCIISDSEVKVCILDSGVNNTHPLLAQLLSNNDCLTVQRNWGTDDHYSGSGHGTLVAGIAGYGDLQQSLLSQSTIELNHKLCSVKILPRNGSNEENLYGDVTKQAVSIAEIASPTNTLIFAMTVTAKDKFGRGRPSAWSSAIDEITYGKGINQKLFLISAGNLSREEGWDAYPDSNLVTSVQDPAQSWNSLVIGAFTQKITITDHLHMDSTPIAEAGGLSPFSTTSNTWESKWPIKPDVVFEGGNLLKTTSGDIHEHADLFPLSTSKNFLIRQFDTLHATSSSLAYASWFAAQISASYPDAWPETVRALMVHSADWTDVMKREYGSGLTSKQHYLNLLRTCGYGVPDLNRALAGTRNAFTMILQETIQPFEKIRSSNAKAKDMNLHILKWPKELLLSLGELPVKMKITLSYFIEPSPGDRGWKNKYRYQSHGLRFDLNSEGETLDEFKKRINVAAREDGEEIENISGRERWLFGKSNRGRGSLHADVWHGTAAQVATCNTIAVFPVIGWWRELTSQRKFNTSTRYSLIVSLITDPCSQDIYTEVKNMISIPVPIEVNI